MKLYNEQDKIYIDKVEAYEIAMGRGIERLPKQGREIVTCRQVGIGDSVLGKDEQGYYVVECINYNGG